MHAGSFGFLLLGLLYDCFLVIYGYCWCVGERVGHANLCYGSRMNKGVVVFLKEERFVAELIVSSVSLKCVGLTVFSPINKQILHSTQSR